MKDKRMKMRKIKRIGMIAHDNRKKDLIEWGHNHLPLLKPHKLFATGTTGKLIEDSLRLKVTCFKSGPLGGDQQIGAMIAEGALDFLIFFWDPLQPQPHDPDVKALLRLAVVWNIPVACNRASADFLFSSTLMQTEYMRLMPNFEEHNSRLDS